MISERSSQAGHWASERRQKPPDPQANAYREASDSREAATIASMEKLGPGLWALMPKAGYRGKQWGPHICRIARERSGCEARLQRMAKEALASLPSRAADVTIEQPACKAWFLLRAFRLTSGASTGLLRALGKMPEISASRRELLSLIGIEIVEEPHSAVDEARQTLEGLTPQSAMNMAVKGLKNLLRSLKRKRSGKKAILVSRLIEAREGLRAGARAIESEAADLKNQLEAVAISSWLMKPLAKAREGSWSEADALRRVPGFVEDVWQGKAQALAAQGRSLARRRDFPMAAASVDGALVIW